MTTSEITDPSEDRPNKAIIVANGFSVEVSKAALFKEQGGSADVEIPGECRVADPRLAYLLVDPRNNVEVAVSVVADVSESEIVDLGPPASVRTWDFDVGYSTDRIVTREG